MTNGVFFDNNISSNDYGIYLSESKYNLIKENYIFNNTWDGILLKVSSNYTTIETNNIVNNSRYGIYIEDNSNSNTIIGNTVHNNTENGIFLEQGYNNTIIGNIVHNNTENGILLISSSNNNTIYDNSIESNNNYGIEILGSNYNHIKENFIYNNTSHGIELGASSNNNTIEANTIIENSQGIDLIDSDGNVIIDNMVNGSSYAGIYVSNAIFTKIRGNIVYNNTRNGIVLDYGRNGTIAENTVYNNLMNGISLLSSDNNYNNITSNTVYNNTENGIKLFNSNFNLISENEVYNNILDGILIYGDSNDITNNIVKDNNENGIHIDPGNYNYIDSNTVRDNAIHGIFLEEGTDYNEITENIIHNNTIGIEIDSMGDNNSIYQNLFLKNGNHAVDDGTDNKWNSTTIGNYWDNWTSPDVSPNDGIVDVPYNISGSAGSVDYLPIAEDGAPRITINSPSGGDAFSSTAPSFDVTITDDYLDDMWYSIDGGLNNYTFTANGIIEQAAWGPISDGALTLAFYASDIFGNIGFAEVIIEKDTQAPIITIYSPNPGEIFGNDAPSYNVTVTDPNLDSVWLELNGTNYELSTPIIGTINQTVWAALPEGSYIITLHANDTLGQSTSQSVTITKTVPSGGGIGLDYVVTSFLIFITGGIGVIVVIVVIRAKKRVKYS